MANKLSGDKYFVVSELFILLVVAMCGTVVELFFSYIGVWAEPVHVLFPPEWLLTLWFAFALCLRVSFLFLSGRLRLSFILGAVFAPLSYWAGSRLSPTYELSSNYTALIIISLTWGITFSSLVFASRYIPQHISMAMSGRAESGKAPSSHVANTLEEL